LTVLHSWMRNDRHARPKAYAAMVIVCLALLALLTVIQVIHVHSANTDADHCPVCVVLHAAAPMAVAATIIVLVQFETLAQVVEVRPVGTHWHRQLFIRPPPCI
jgi:hypothetical protein